MARIALIALIFASIGGAARAETLTGIPTVIDGDTLRIAEQTVRLYGIDAPDERQTCTLEGRAWGCGRDAAFALADAVGRHWVSCTVREKRADVALAICRAGPVDLAELMVRKGFALADRELTAAYTVPERAARDARAGLWKSSFVKPWDWAPPATTAR